MPAYNLFQGNPAAGSITCFYPNVLGQFVKVFRAPVAVKPMGAAHVFFDGHVLSGAENPFVGSDTLRSTVNLNGVPVVLQLNLAANVTVRDTVIVFGI